MSVGGKVDVAVKWVNTQGVYRGGAKQLERRIAKLDGLAHGARQLAAQLCDFVATQESQAKPRERLAGSTEILESCFGKFKQLEKQQSRGGFTQLLLGFGSQLIQLVPQTVANMLQRSKTHDVRQWASQHLGATVFTQRKLAFESATKSG